MIGVTIKETGLKDMLKLFEELPAAMGKRVLKQALMKASMPLRDAMIQSAPVRSGGGDLQASIKSTHNKADDHSASVLVGSRKFYARFLELGTEKIRPVGFMRRSFDETTREVIETFKTECNAGLKRAVARYRRRG